MTIVSWVKVKSIAECSSWNKNIGFLSNTGMDSLNNHKATKPAFIVGPSLARQENAIEMMFAGGLIMACFEWYLDPLI